MRELIKNGTRLLFRRQTSILSAAFLIMCTYALSYLIGFLKTRLLISHFFDTPDILDAYYAAFQIPDTIFQLLVAGSVSAAFIPVFTRYLTKNETEAWRIANSSISIVLTLITGISLLIFLLSPDLARSISPGFNQVQLDLVVNLLRIMLLAQLFFSVSSFLTAIIQSHQRFLIPAMAPVVYNMGIILGIIVGSPFVGIYGPAYGMVVGALFHALVQLPLAWRLGFRPHFSLNWKHAGVREIVKLMPARTLALGIDQVEHLISVILCSFLATGTLSLLNFARMISSLPGNFFGVAIGQAALPALSHQSSSDNLVGFKRTLTESLLQILFLAFPLSVLFMVLRIPIVRLAFGAPAFPWAATLLTGKALAILAATSSFYAGNQLVVRGFYALHDTRTPLKVGLGFAVFDAVLSILATRVLGCVLLGLVFSISATVLLESITLIIILAKKLKFSVSEEKEVFFSILKISTVSLILGLSLWVPMRLLDRFVFDTTRTIPLITLTAITSIIGFSAFLSFSYLFKIRELSTFISLLYRMKKWRSVFSLRSKRVASVPVAE